MVRLPKPGVGDFDGLDYDELRMMVIGQGLICVLICQ